MMKNKIAILVLFAFLLNACNKSDSDEKKASTLNETADWMQILLKNKPDEAFKLSNICMTGSHDAGMFIVQDCSFGANSCNTQTQYLDFKGQLEGGARIFDVRPIFYKNKFYTQHATDCDGLGCKGDKMDNILQQTNAFLNNHAEIVIFSFTHFCKMNGNDEAFISLLENTFGDKIYKDTDPSIPLQNKLLRDILPADLSSGKIILMFENGFENTAENKQKGYFTADYIPTAGGWSNKNILSVLKADQISKYDAYDPSGGRLFHFSWQMTQDAGQAVQCALTPNGYSIQDMAKKTNAELGIAVDSLIAAGQISAYKFPHVIWMDDVDAKGTLVANKINSLIHP